MATTAAIQPTRAARAFGMIDTRRILAKCCFSHTGKNDDGTRQWSRFGSV
jgi:hypothetical protein